MKNEFILNQILFAEHNEIMRAFRSSHHSFAMVNGAKPNESSLFRSTRPLSGSRLQMEIGGLRLTEKTFNWMTLVPITMVASYKVLPN